MGVFAVAGTYPLFGLRSRPDDLELIMAEPKSGINMAPIFVSALNSVTFRPGGKKHQRVIFYRIKKIIFICFHYS